MVSSALLNPLSVAVDAAGDLFVTNLGDNTLSRVSPDTGVKTVIRIDPNTGAQTLVSYGLLLVAGNTGITGMAVEADGDLLAIDRRSPFGVIRIDVLSGEQTGLDIGASPIDAIAVVPTR